MPEKLDRCVSDVKADGKSEDSAYAICNSSIKEQVANSMLSMIQGIDETDTLFQEHGTYLPSGEHKVKEHDNPLDIPFGYELNVNETASIPGSLSDVSIGAKKVKETACKPCVQDKFMKQQVLRSIVDSRSS